MRFALALPRHRQEKEKVLPPEGIESRIFRVHTELASARTNEKLTGSPCKEVDQLIEKLAKLYVERRKMKH